MQPDDSPTDRFRSIPSPAVARDAAAMATRRSATTSSTASTTRQLEERVAGLLGTEEALLLPVGHPGKSDRIALVTEPGTELLLEANGASRALRFSPALPRVGRQIRPNHDTRCDC